MIKDQKFWPLYRAKAIHMLREIGAQLSDSLRFKLIALLVEVMENARQFKDVVEDQCVGHQRRLYFGLLWGRRGRRCKKTQPGQNSFTHVVT